MKEQVKTVHEMTDLKRNELYPANSIANPSIKKQGSAFPKPETIQITRTPSNPKIVQR
jgi:hypothetical protein